MQKLASRFVAATDDDGTLRAAQSEEGRFFRRLVDELGHFKGTFDPEDPKENNKQGIYCITPGGTYLDSVYSIDEPTVVSEMLGRALKKWDALPEGGRFAAGPIDPAGATSRQTRKEEIFPEDGLVLLESMRDLPRRSPGGGSDPGSWNKDYAWFSKAEARDFLPRRLEKGATAQVPERLVQRLAAHHFVDYVRCIGYPFEIRSVEIASLTSTVVSFNDGRVSIRLEGKSRASQRGPEGIRPEAADQNNQTRGIEVTILGRATWDPAAEKFTAFDLVAIGDRWGGVSSSRWEDLGRHPIGFEFRLAGDGPMDRTPPYGLAWDSILEKPYR